MIMVNRRMSYVFWLATFSIGVVSARESINPCHPKSIKKEPGVDCDQISIPVGFCSDCLMSPFNDAGEFSDCTRTANLTDTCIDAIDTYVENNPCDTNRREALKTFFTVDPIGQADAYEQARLRLDWFVFSLCEQGCDCIPQNHADRNNRVIDVTRGNCQAHVFYHICKLMPGIKLLRLLDDEPLLNVTSIPTVCGTVKKWLKSLEGPWLEIAQTHVEPHVKTFIEKYIEAEQLFELDDHWNQCFDLELAQNRISEDDVASSDVMSFSLLDVDSNDTLIEVIEDYSKIDVVPGTNLSVRANVMTAPGSVRFDVNGEENIQTENFLPYAIAGDYGFAKYKPWEYTVGISYEVTATTFSEPHRHGTKGVPLTVHFTFSEI